MIGGSTFDDCNSVTIGVEQQSIDVEQQSIVDK